MTPVALRRAAYDTALSDASRLLAAGDLANAFVKLERAHVLGQRDFGRHLRVHLQMLPVAWAMGDSRELRGQLLRIVLTPVGHLTGRLPLGNTGASNVSPFAPLPVSSELRRLLDDDET